MIVMFFFVVAVFKLSFQQERDTERDTISSAIINSDPTHEQLI